jgi:hypothetical protein
MSYKVIDNFLEEEFYLKISNDLKSEHLPWFFKKVDVITTNDEPKNKNGFFSFCYYNNFKPDHQLFYTHMIPILEKLNVLSLLQIRANLNLRDKDSKESNFHVDYPSAKLTTAIFYLTTCNAKTVLKINNKDVLINSVENRILIFPTNIKHKAIYQNDVHKRYVINFNFLTG